MNRPSAALVVASLALAAALAPPAYSAVAEKLAKNSVGSPQIKDKSIRPADLGKNAVTASKIGAGQVRSSDLANGSVDFSKIADGTVGRGELAASSVDGGKIANGSVGHEDLASPVAASGWAFVPTSDVPVAQDASVSLGSLAVNGGGPITVNRTSRLVISGALYAQAVETTDTPFKGRLTCTLSVDGNTLLPQFLLRIEQTDEATVPVACAALVQPGAHDVALGCRNPTNAPVTMSVGRVAVNVLAVPQ